MKRTTTIIVCLLLAGSAAAGLPTIWWTGKAPNRAGCTLVRSVYGRVVGDPFAEYNPTEPGRIVCRSRPACLSRRVATARSARRALPLLCASTSPGGVYGAYEGDRKNPIPTGGIVNPRPKE